nr:glycosyltransferase [Tessaracoccus coleopterorum]
MELQPDVIVTDVHLLPLATEVATAFRSTGHRVGVVYDAREYVYGLASEDPFITQGFPPSSRSTSARSTPRSPSVNPSPTSCRRSTTFRWSRVWCPTPHRGTAAHQAPHDHPGLPEAPGETPILVYAGGLSYHRGVHDVVAALPDLPEVHLAIGARRGSSYVVELEEQAERLGVAGRVHFIPFAPTHEVAEYLASATAAIFPFLPVGNHNWAAPNKYYESVQARLPILTSNMEWLTERITRLGIGEVFEHSNPASIVEATRKLLGDLDTYRARLTDDLVRAHTFEQFEPTVQEIVLGVTAERAREGLRPSSLQGQLTAIRRDMLRQRASLSDSEIFEPRPRLRIGTANTGGQPCCGPPA